VALAAGPPEAPETGSAGEVTNTSAVLSGVLNPHAGAPSSVGWYFEYNEGAVCTGGSTTPVQGEVEAQGTAVSAQISGLTPGRQYSFCSVAHNAAEEITAGQAVSFTTSAAAPVVDSESSSHIGSSSASVSAMVNPLGSTGSYRVEYGTSAGYGTSTPAVELPSATGRIGISATLSALQAGTAYHFRFTATNAFGNTHGEDLTFSTPFADASSGVLPDGRVYELVSPLGNSDADQPEAGLQAVFSGHFSAGPFRAAADGEAMAYHGGAPASGVGGDGIWTGPGANQYVASRTPSGWTANNIEPPTLEHAANEEVYFQAFSNDLSTAFFSSLGKGPLAAAPVCERASRGMYSHAGDGGGFRALFTATLDPGECGHPLFAGQSADGSHVLFQTEAALIAPAVPATGSGGEFCLEECNLYESAYGTLSLVNVLPSGEVDPHATFGGPTTNGVPAHLPALSNVISADGSRVFWSDVNTGVLYLREDGVSTTQISAGTAKFWTASTDGRFAFYTEGEKLLRFDVEDGTREELAGAGAGVQGVSGVSEDGSYVYFVANGVLAPRAASGDCKESYVLSEEREDQCNLYVLHLGEPVRFIATLAAIDNGLPGRSGDIYFRRELGDWRQDLGSRMAEVTPDGRDLVFSSVRSLTGYDNVAPNDPEHLAIPEVFVYQDSPGGRQLSCASCDPGGGPPTADVAILPAGNGARYLLGGFMTPSGWGSYTLRSISADGNRVFFNTAQPLVAQDTNRWTDVYEWERGGTGSCRLITGCVYLLSGGVSTDNSTFLDASADGNDVFFVTRAQLVAGDRDELFNVYDARAPHAPGESVGFREAATPVCSGADCQGPPPVAPVFAAPSSATFSGAGNLTPPTAVVKSKPKPRSKPRSCRKGFVKKHGRCVKRAGTSRAKTPGKHAKRGRKG